MDSIETVKKITYFFYLPQLIMDGETISMLLMNVSQKFDFSHI